MSETKDITGTDDALLSSVDADIACGYELHRSVGSGAAAWAVWYVTLSVCGCSNREFVYFCAPCWTYRNRLGRVRCRNGHVLGVMDDITRVQWIGSSR